MPGSRKAGAELFIGTSGYSYPDWKGIVSAFRQARRRWLYPRLTFLSRYFNTCEINATFYRRFEPEIAKKWSDAVENPDFEIRNQSKSGVHPCRRHKAKRTESTDIG